MRGDLELRAVDDLLGAAAFPRSMINQITAHLDHDDRISTSCMRCQIATARRSGRQGWWARVRRRARARARGSAYSWNARKPATLPRSRRARSARDIKAVVGILLGRRSAGAPAPRSTRRSTPGWRRQRGSSKRGRARAAADVAPSAARRPAAARLDHEGRGGRRWSGRWRRRRATRARRRCRAVQWTLVCGCGAPAQVAGIETQQAAAELAELAEAVLVRERIVDADVAAARARLRDRVFSSSDERGRRSSGEEECWTVNALT